MDSAFDPVAFLASAQSAEFDTRTLLCKAGDWDGMIGTGEKDVDIKAASWADKQTGEQVTAQVLEVYCYTENPTAVPEGGKSPIGCKLSIFLDLGPDGKSLDKTPGKNRGLGYLLTATGHQDKTGKQIKPWSKTSLAGQRIKFRVEHKPRKDSTDGTMDARVTQVASPA